MVGPICIPWIIPLIIPLHIPIKPYKTAIYQQNLVHDSSITFPLPVVPHKAVAEVSE